MIKQYMKGRDNMSKRIEKVEPIRTTEDIQEMIQAIKWGTVGRRKKEDLANRDVLMFLMGINTGLRVSDLLQIKIRDVKGKDSFTIVEGKTDKRRTVNISMLKKEIEEYTKGKPEDDYLFRGQRANKPISTVQAYRILRQAADLIGLDYIGTHSMRKTFGYHHYKRFKDVAILQEIFNHH